MLFASHRNLRATNAAILALAMACLAASAAEGTLADAVLTIKGDQPQLFLHDDYLVERTQGLKLVLGKVEKHVANPILRADRSWERYGVGYLCAYQDEEEGV